MNQVIVEETINAPIETVWAAITSAEKMRSWYFNIPTFLPEPGFKFQFSAGSEGKTYVHLCEVTEVVAPNLLSYSWRFENVPGNSTVSFQLQSFQGKTAVTLLHTGLQTFPADNPDLKPANFQQGWKFIIGTSLRNFVENEQSAPANSA